MVVFLGANSADVEIPPSKSHRVQYLQGEAPVGWFIHPVYNMYLTIVMALALPVRHQNHILTRTKRCIDSDNSDQASMPGHRLRAWPYDPLFAHHCPSHERALMRRNNSLSVGFFCALLCMNFGILPSPQFFNLSYPPETLALSCLSHQISLFEGPQMVLPPARRNRAAAILLAAGDFSRFAVTAAQGFFAARLAVEALPPVASRIGGIVC